MVWLKRGAKINGLRRPMITALVDLCDMLEEGGILTITSGTDIAPGRVKDSLHASGYALDFRYTPDLDMEKVVNHFLDSDYDLVLEDDHFHLEFDPR